MARLPREEISYKKIYRNLDINKDLEINWEKAEEPKITLPSVLDSKVLSNPDSIDEFDEHFCKANDRNPEEVLEKLTALNRSFKQHICEMLDRLSPIKSDNLYCDICGEDEEKEDRLEVCNGCGIAVHRECYGVSESFCKFWFCTFCFFEEFAGPCLACNENRGIMKRTGDGRWIHAICQALNSSATYLNQSRKDPVDVSDLKKCSGVCGICDEKSEYLIKCSYYGCKHKFHPICAAENLYCDLNNKVIYCEKHDCLAADKMLSGRKIIQQRISYPALEHEIFIRRLRKIQKPQMTKVRKIMKTIPFCCIKELNSDPKIIEYWVSKRKAMGYFCDGLFWHINYLNK